MEKMGNVLRSLRIREDLTQEELAKKVGIARSNIGMYENGERVPPLKILEGFVDFFNVDMNYITGRTEKEYYHDLQNLKTKKIPGTSSRDIFIRLSSLCPQASC